MEENKKSSTQLAMTYGVILAVLTIVFGLITFLLEVEYDSSINYAAYVLVVIVLYMVMVNYRDKQQQGIASFGTLFGLGFKTILISSIIGAIFTYIFVVAIDTSMIDQILLKSEEGMLERGMSDEEIEQALVYTERFGANPIAISIWGFVFSLVVGTVLSLIIAIFTKREGTPA